MEKAMRRGGYERETVDNGEMGKRTERVHGIQEKQKLGEGKKSTDSGPERFMARSG